MPESYVAQAIDGDESEKYVYGTFYVLESCFAFVNPNEYKRKWEKFASPTAGAAGAGAAGVLLDAGVNVIRKKLASDKIERARRESEEWAKLPLEQRIAIDPRSWTVDFSKVDKVALSENQSYLKIKSSTFKKGTKNLTVRFGRGRDAKQERKKLVDLLSSISMLAGKVEYKTGWLA